MNRLTTDDEKSIMYHLNTFYAKNGEVWVRNGGPYPDFQDVTLVQWIRSASSKHGLNFTAEDPEDLGDEMYDALQDGDETVEGIIALMHEAAVQAAEMRGRLKPFEDILGEEYDLDRLRELVEADRDGRVKIHPKPEKNTCGSCGNFHRIPGTRCGTCDKHIRYRNRYGQEDERRGTFTPYQSRNACKNYVLMDEGREV